MSEHTSTMTPEFEQRLREQTSERETLAQDLRQKYLMTGVTDEVATKVFNKAWEDAHSEGNYAVEIQYDEVSEIANAAFKAGKADR